MRVSVEGECGGGVIFVVRLFETSKQKVMYVLIKINACSTFIVCVDVIVIVGVHKF